MSLSSSELGKLRISDPNAYITQLEAKLFRITMELEHVREEAKALVEEKDQLSSKLAETPAPAEVSTQEVAELKKTNEHLTYEIDLLTNTNEQLRQRIEEQHEVIQEFISTSKSLFANKTEEERVAYETSLKNLVYKLEHGIPSEVVSTHGTSTSSPSFLTTITSWWKSSGSATNTKSTGSANRVVEEDGDGTKQDVVVDYISTPDATNVESTTTTTTAATPVSGLSGTSDIDGRTTLDITPLESSASNTSTSMNTTSSSTTTTSTTSTTANTPVDSFDGKSTSQIMHEINALLNPTIGYTSDIDFEMPKFTEQSITPLLVTNTSTTASLPYTFGELNRLDKIVKKLDLVSPSTATTAPPHTAAAVSFMKPGSNSSSISPEKELLMKKLQDDLNHKVEFEKRFVKKFTNTVVTNFLLKEDERKQAFESTIEEMRKHVTRDKSLYEAEREFFANTERIYRNKERLELEIELNTRMQNGIRDVILNPNATQTMKEQAVFLLCRGTALSTHNVAQVAPIIDATNMDKAPNVCVIQHNPATLDLIRQKDQRLAQEIEKINKGRVERLASEAKRELLEAKLRRMTGNVEIHKPDIELQGSTINRYEPVKYLTEISKTIDKVIEMYKS